MGCGLSLIYRPRQGTNSKRNQAHGSQDLYSWDMSLNYPQRSVFSLSVTWNLSNWEGRREGRGLGLLMPNPPELPSANRVLKFGISAACV